MKNYSRQTNVTQEFVRALQKSGAKSTRPSFCAVCGSDNFFEFEVPDSIWKLVVPKLFPKKMVCLSCFDGFAAKRRINYAGGLTCLKFRGKGASFDFEIKNGKSKVEKDHVKNTAKSRKGAARNRSTSKNR
jgi:hypothetical protein